MSAVGSETVVVSSDAVILTREQARYVMSALNFVRANHPSVATSTSSGDVYDALVEQVGP